MVKKKELLLFIVLVLLGLFFLYIYSHIKQIQVDIYNRVQKNELQQISYFFNNIQNNLSKKKNIKNSDDLVLFLSNKNIRKTQEQYLSLLITPKIKYLYLLVKDDKNRFRFLLDASRTDKANFYQKFDVTDAKYTKLYTTKKVQIIQQEDMGNLYLTYLYPLMLNDEVVAVLSVDITTKIHNKTLDLIKPLETFFIILIVFIFLLLAMGAIQLFYYFITRKKIFTDPLTKLFNRNYLNETSKMIKLENYSVAMLDLDKFKLINDTYGHDAGDYVLSLSSKILSDSIRGTDILIRYGGEEFLLLIYNRHNTETALSVCERIRENLNEQTFTYDNHEINVQISIGLYENPHLEKDVNDAIKIADEMLYLAKSEGRNRVVRYQENKEKIISKIKDINFVKQALHDDRIICYYQPIYNHHTKQILKYEALVRIVDTDGKIIPPFSFLPEIKSTNIHYKLTQRIFSIIFDKFKNNNESVSINVNFADLMNDDIEASIVEVLSKNKHLASRVTFEILESDEINNIPVFQKKIKLLHSLGAEVSIDDFGSGYSNFRTVLDIEANYLKIDGSLIKNIDTNEKDYKVVESIIHFAKVSNMKTVAEFVHSSDVYNKLLTLEVDYMQGYYIAQPHSELTSLDNLFL